MTCFVICGDSGAGKTTMATALADRLLDSTVLECDRYHRWERHDPHWKECTHLNPEANDIDLMNSDIQTLMSGNSIFRRDYSHVTGKFTENREIKSTRHLVVSGLHTLMCNHDVGIFMDTDQVLKTQWKISRDIGKRGYTLSEVKEQIQNRQEDYESFVRPLMLRADVIVNFSTESNLYIDSIKGIGRFLRIFVRDNYKPNNILDKLDSLEIDYVFGKGDRSGFWQIDIKHITNGYYYDYAVLCVLDVAKQKCNTTI
jgi:uridine kinase